MGTQPVRKTESDSIIERLLAAGDAPGRAKLVGQYPAIAWDDIVQTLTEKVWQEVRVDTHRAQHLAGAFPGLGRRRDARRYRHHGRCLLSKLAVPTARPWRLQ